MTAQACISAYQSKQPHRSQQEVSELLKSVWRLSREGIWRFDQMQTPQPLPRQWAFGHWTAVTANPVAHPPPRHADQEQPMRPTTASPTCQPSFWARCRGHSRDYRSLEKGTECRKRKENRKLLSAPSGHGDGLGGQIRYIPQKNSQGVQVFTRYQYQRCSDVRYDSLLQHFCSFMSLCGIEFPLE